MDEILTIKQRLKQAEEKKCTDEINHLRNENNYKSTMIKNTVGKSILTNAANKHSLNETTVAENNDENPANVPFKILKRAISINPLSVNLTKWSNKLKQFISNS